MWFNLGVIFFEIIIVIQHEKTMFMHTNYTSLHYFNYLTFCVSYISSVNCIGFHIVNCTIGKTFIDTLSLDKKLLKFEVHKRCQILCAHKHCFLMLVT